MIVQSCKVSCLYYSNDPTIRPKVIKVLALFLEIFSIELKYLVILIYINFK